VGAAALDAAFYLFAAQRGEEAAPLPFLACLHGVKRRCGGERRQACSLPLSGRAAGVRCGRLAWLDVVCVR